MMLIIKYLLTAAIVVLVSEAAKRNEHLGAFLASLPVVTLLVLIWLHLEKSTPEQITNHAFYTFWYVVPTLPMFLIFPWLYYQLGFWLGLGLSAAMTVGVFFIWGWALKPFGIELW
ncbi:DUF3147 family protein [Veronia pacifica]|uniref:DUF3147 family protein n=1 Tax=Veronia pacifica TaxID=1080227 RepID=A0A1C3ESE2_9GAMM|nr:DUF3147 family protein [Veronia pacifica]ODA36192.1 hypothetical protein A8L45_00890 [Veronia pacifica]